MLAVAGLRAGAQGTELDRIFQDQDLESLIDQALQLNITAKVLPPGETPVWNSAGSKVTLPGRAVAVRLVGEKLHIDVVFTPYEEENGELLLVAQGQIWMAGAQETRYFTTFKSVPVDIGEKVLFFPLGLSPRVQQADSFTLQIEVEIYPYRKLLEKQKAAAEKAAAEKAAAERAAAEKAPPAPSVPLPVPPPAVE
jgi:hypothetical protein